MTDVARFLQNTFYVSIHTPTKGVTVKAAVCIGIERVSIHTPTKGVTLFFKPCKPIISVSIHTPTKGVTMVSLQPILNKQEGFNPHTHEGCDKTRRTIQQMVKVSIHTPTKGVTQILITILKPTRFQSTHPRRV